MTRENGSSVSVGALAIQCGESLKPWLSPPAARYALERLWETVSGGCGSYGGRARIVFPASAESDAWSLVKAPRRSVGWADLVDVLPPGAEIGIDTGRLPILFPARSSGALVQRIAESQVTFQVDLPSSAFFMLSRWEEWVGDARDQHGRYPANASVAAQQGFLDRPVIDEWALILRSWLTFLDPKWEPHRKGFQVLLSHDIDHLQRFPTVRSIGYRVKQSLRNKDLRGAVRQLKAGTRSLISPEQDPYYRGTYMLMDRAEAAGFRAAFFFKTAGSGRFDSGYDLRELPFRSLVSDVLSRGHEVGFHAGYESVNDSAILLAEKDRLEAILREPFRGGGRQHYLRFSAPSTWRELERLGLSYDSTLGYPERAGFRCGTCHSFPVYDVEFDTALNLLEIPLIVMEGTLVHGEHGGLSPGEAIEYVLLLASRCATVGGVFTLLWHNTSFEDEYYEYGAVYGSLLTRLRNMASAYSPELGHRPALAGRAARIEERVDGGETTGSTEP